MQRKPPSAITLAIADDHAIVREGIKGLVVDESDIELTGEASNGDQAIQLYMERRPDVLLLDIAMPGTGGLDALHGIREFDDQARVLIFSMYPEGQFALPYIKAGADGYLEKSCDGETLLLAIRLVASGKKYISPEIAAILAEQLSAPHETLPHEELTSREYQIMSHLATGMSIIQTADAMSLSSRTISTYRKRILNKMRLRNTAELVQYAFRHKLFTP